MLSQLESNINTLLSKNIIKYGLVLALVLLSINIKYIPYNYLEIVNSNLNLIILGLVVVYFVYVDFVLAIALTLVIILSIQEYNTRKTVINNQLNNIDTGVNDTSSINQNNNSKANQNLNMNGKYTGTIPVSSYTSQLTYPDKNNTDEKFTYETQIGQISPEKDTEYAFSQADEKYQAISFRKMALDLCDKEKFNNSNDSLEKKLYDHPASKTMTELLRLEGVSLVDDEVFSKLQTNSASDLSIDTPCAIESISCSLNAQSF